METKTVLVIGLMLLSVYVCHGGTEDGAADQTTDSLPDVTSTSTNTDTIESTQAHEVFATSSNTIMSSTDIVTTSLPVMASSDNAGQDVLTSSLAIETSTYGIVSTSSIDHEPTLNISPTSSEPMVPVTSNISATDATTVTDAGIVETTITTSIMVDTSNVLDSSFSTSASEPNTDSIALVTPSPSESTSVTPSTSMTQTTSVTSSTSMPQTTDVTSSTSMPQTTNVIISTSMPTDITTATTTNVSTESSTVISATSSSSVTSMTTVATTSPDPCASIDCVNGTCTRVENGTAVCQCDPGFTGTKCESNINECANVTCQNGGTCTDLVNAFTCICDSGWSGIYCEIDIDDCEDVTCENGGTCVDLINDFKCTCTAGWEGKNCSTDIDDCEDVTCENGGTCVDLINDFKCTCTAGWEGKNCSTDINECARNPCDENANCTNNAGSYRCDCRSGFSGSGVECSNIDDCMNDTCGNGGTCVDLINDYNCTCTTGWKGTNCSKDIDECYNKTHECHHNAANCTNTEGSYNCTCLDGFEGDGRTCTDINECESKVSECNETGTRFCYNTNGGYHCICESGWKGVQCNEDINECTTGTNNCDKNATCDNTPGGYNCTCHVGFRGNGTSCTEKVLFDFTGGVYHYGNDEIYGPFNISSGIAYNSKLFYQIYVSMNGYITLGRRFDRIYPPTDRSVWKYLQFPIIYPLWADIETMNPSSGIYIHELKKGENDTELDLISTAFGISSFMPRYSFVVTWKGASPYPYSENHQYESGDFQVILATNGSETNVMFNYDQELFTWKEGPARYVSVGYSASDFNGAVEFDRSNFTNVNNDSNTGKIGRFVYQVSTPSEELLNASECNRWLDNSTYIQHIESSMASIMSCPCTYRQAFLDGRFREKHMTSDYHKYESRFVQFGNKQRCHYDNYGGLLTGQPNGGYPDIGHPDKSSDDLYDICSGSLLSKFFSLIKSNNCGGYIPPSWSPSWGDPHITTFDGADYTFNGLGEYTLTRINNGSSTIEVQVRTEKFNNNTKATVFVGLAFQENNATTIEIYLNRSSNSTEVYINGKERANNSHTTESLELTSPNNSLLIHHNIGLTIQINVSNILDITSKLAEGVAPVGGLLGNNNKDKTDDFVHRNKTTYSVNSTEKELFKFGSSWAVENTLFLKKNITFDSNFTPDFISDLIKKGNQSVADFLLKNCNNTDTSLVESCDDNIACIVDAAATCNREMGKMSKKNEEETKEKKTEANHFPPNITGPDTIYIGYMENTTVNINIQASENADGTVSTTLTDNAYNFKKGNNGIWIFSWNNTEILRNRNNLTLQFTAKDSTNSTKNYSPQIIYCGCEKSSECDLYSVGTEKGQYKSRSCKCSQYTTGSFCNSSIDVCELDVCYPNVTCNSSSSATSLCGSCPDGLVGDGTKCENLNECYLNTSGCAQKCTDSLGSYTCDCWEGYRLKNDKHQCEDIDECSDPKKCDDMQYCVNTEGSHECMCRPGYVRENNACVEVESSFVGKLVFKTSADYEKPEFKTGLKTLIRKFFENLNVTQVEILEIQGIDSQRRKRAAASNGNKMLCEYIIHENSQSKTSVYVEAFANYVSSAAINNIITTTTGQIYITIYTNESKVYSDDDAALCRIDNRVNCDLDSTNCVVTDGTYSCECKDGFKKDVIDGSRCQDIDECSKSEGQACKDSGGNCINSVGSYDCLCPDGYEFDRNTPQCKDMCLSGPCQNEGICQPGEAAGQIICKCDDKWTGAYCETENSELSRLKVIAIAVGASAGALCFILLFVMLGMYRRHKNRRFRYSRRPLSMSDDFNGLAQSNLRYHKDMPIDDDDDNIETATTFSIPRAKLRASEYNTIEDVDNVTGKEQEDDQPLTSQNRQSGESEKFGRSNPSFLHSDEGERRTGMKAVRNSYEYF